MLSAHPNTISDGRIYRAVEIRLSSEYRRRIVTIPDLQDKKGHIGDYKNSNSSKVFKGQKQRRTSKQLQYFTRSFRLTSTQMLGLFADTTKRADTSWQSIIFSPSRQRRKNIGVGQSQLFQRMRAGVHYGLRISYTCVQ